MVTLNGMGISLDVLHLPLFLVNPLARDRVYKVKSMGTESPSTPLCPLFTCDAVVLERKPLSE